MIPQADDPRWFYLGSAHQARVSFQPGKQIAVQVRQEVVLSDGTPMSSDEFSKNADKFFSGVDDGKTFIRDGNIVGSGWVDETDETRRDDLIAIAMYRFAKLYDAVLASQQQ